MKTTEEKIETLKGLIYDSISSLLYYDRKNCEDLSIQDIDEIIYSYPYKINLVNDLTESFREHLTKHMDEKKLLESERSEPMIKVKVLKRHVEKAKKFFNKSGSLISQTCPVALAIKEKQKKFVCVGITHIRINKIAYNIPEKVAQFISKFDNNEFDEMKTPFTFEISRAGA